ALGKLEGRPLIGVITSIGVRRDASAVAQLSALLNNSDEQVVDAAARALGDIGNSASAAALKTAMLNASKTKLLSLFKGLFRTAEALADAGQRDQAAAIYEQLRGFTSAPHQVCSGALRGAILTRKDGLSLLKESLHSDDYLIFSAAVKTTMEMQDSEVTEILTSALDKLPLDNKILVIQTLGARGDDKALPTLASMSRNAPKAVRIAAIKATPMIKGATGLSLVGLLDDSDRDISQEAQENFAAIQHPSVDQTIIKMFQSNDVKMRLTALELMNRRRMTGCVPDILKATKDSNEQIRLTSIRMMGNLGNSKQLPSLLDLLLGTESPQELNEIRQAIGDLCTKDGDPQSSVGQLVQTLQKAKPSQKIELLRIIGGIGGAEALKAVRSAVDDADTQVHVTAIRALSTWKTPDAAPYLLELAKAADNNADRLLCLRGYLGIAGIGNLPADQRLSMCQQAKEIVKQDQEKTMLLAALGKIDSLAAIKLITPYLSEQAIRLEAATASLGVAERLLNGKNTEVAKILIAELQKVCDTPLNDSLAKRAQDLLAKAKSIAG
ncbi:MAG: HEAT repeat domain-containing protein, partial [Sedimentisphaerales bacterium]|nr:HEAT repeat domain-containing protein [Sedimentisphaerales bacterium]